MTARTLPPLDSAQIAEELVRVLQDLQVGDTRKPVAWAVEALQAALVRIDVLSAELERLQLLLRERGAGR
mgnify:FL=1